MTTTLNIDKSNWKKYRFDEFAQNVSERVEPAQTDLDLYVGLEHIDPDCLHLSRHGHPSDVEGTKLRFYAGDVIFGRRRAYQRKTALATQDGICSAHAMVLRAKENIVDSRFFPFLFHSKQFIDMAITISVGGLSPTINWKDIVKQEFLLPPLAEQQRLAELLWAADEMIEKEKRELEGVELYKQTYISTYLLGGDKKLSLRDLGTVIRGVGYKPENTFDDYNSGSFVLLRSNNISTNFRINFDDVYYIDKSVLKDEQRLQENDIVICMSNGSKELVGKTAEFTGSKYEAVSVGSFCAIYRPKESKYSSLIKFLFQSLEYRKQIALLLSGSNINNLKPSDIEEVKFGVSNLDDSREISNKLNAVENDICMLSRQITKSQEVKQEIINKIF